MLIICLVLLLSSAALFSINYIPSLIKIKTIVFQYLNVLDSSQSITIAASILGVLFLLTAMSGKRKPFTPIATLLFIPLYYYGILVVNCVNDISNPQIFSFVNKNSAISLCLATLVYSVVLYFVTKLNKLAIYAKNNKKRAVTVKKEDVKLVTTEDGEEVEEITVVANDKAKFDFPDIPTSHTEPKRTIPGNRKPKPQVIVEEVKEEVVVVPPIVEKKYNLNEVKKFKTGGIFESSLEAAVFDNPVEVERPTSPIIGYNDKKTLEEKALKRRNAEQSYQETEANFAPKSLDKDHPRFKMFQSLRKTEEIPTPVQKEEVVSPVMEEPIPDNSSSFAPKGLDEKHPRYKMFEALQRREQIFNVEEKEEPIVVSTPSVDSFAPKGLDENHPRYKMFEELQNGPKRVEEVVEESNDIIEEMFAPKSLDKSHPRYQMFENLRQEVKPEVKEEPKIVHVNPSAKYEDPLAKPQVAKSNFARPYNFPTDNLVNDVIETNSDIGEEEYALGHFISETLSQFKVEITLINVTKGPTITMFEYKLAPGLVISKVVGLTPNISLATGGQQIRVLAPIPGKNAIGIEIPNKRRSTVGFKQMLPALRESNLKIPIILGKNNLGAAILTDIAKAPHILIAGTTGSGKSVCINTLICSILYTRKPEDVRMILVDPKVVELKVYNDIPHLLTPVITDLSKVMKILDWVVEEMERRFNLFGQVGARNVSDFNTVINNKNLAFDKLPSILLILDEFADIKLQIGKEIENSINRLMAKSRAAGIHVIIATQRPSAEVITGTIKNNIPTRIAFSVPANINSRIILDEGGAENLLGSGDMLFMATGKNDLERIQCSYLDDDEIERVVNHVKNQAQPDYLDESIFADERDEDEDASGPLDSSNMSIYDQAKEIVFDKGSASASYLQRRLSIGYNKAAKLIEQMEADGIVGPINGSKPREILRFDL